MADLVDVIVEDERWGGVDLPALSQTACAATLMHLGLDPQACEISVLACDDTRIATLNADFREKPQPTNVLSWPAEEHSPPPGEHPEAPEDPELGDIAISYDTCAREAADAEKAFDAHVSHLMVHATLHLLGYDHIDDLDAALMEGLEVEILGKLGISDPYEQ